MVLNAEIELPGIDEPVENQCKVEWAQDSSGTIYPYSIGLSFKDMHSDGTKKMRSYLLNEFASGFGKIGGK